MNWPDTMPGLPAIGSAVALALMCTAFAYVLFFDLLSRTSASTASTVTFIVPVFGVLWGVLFLQDYVTARMITGIIVALTGTVLATGLIRRRRA